MDKVVSALGASDLERPALDIARLLKTHRLPDLSLARTLMCHRLSRIPGVRDVLDAFASIPRHCFAPLARWRVSYLDLNVWTGSTWLTAPSTIVRAVAALPHDSTVRILEVGTGTGYQAALLTALGATVTSVDISARCVSEAHERFKALGASSARITCGNALVRNAVSGEFDGVVVNGAVSAAPTQLFRLLPRSGGVIIAPVIFGDGSQRLIQYRVVRGSRATLVDLGRCKFVPIIPGN